MRAAMHCLTGHRGAVALVAGSLAVPAASPRRQTSLRAEGRAGIQFTPAHTVKDPRTGMEMRLGDPCGMNHGPLRIFAGNAHPALAAAVAKQIGVELGDATVDRFACGEVNVVLNESVRDCDVFVIQPTCNGGAGPNEHLMELLIMLDAIRRGAANRVTAVIPIYGYGRFAFISGLWIQTRKFQFPTSKGLEPKRHFHE
eukprot:TRINITY_DN11139_c0_g1_i3.p1 TRINITY_DN11139_c0_g1~~TRINITY_DN11139_c0_g1_i3.p1  ORF type:complete len:199 (-),score=32.95 TRINITY_DN11139_c0_g1_i3:46-642(-)